MAGLKMFYRLMLDKGRIEPADYDLMLQDIAENDREYIRPCEF